VQPASRDPGGVAEISVPGKARDRAVVGCGVSVAVACFLLLLATAPRLAIVWDEAYTLARLDRVRAWFSALSNPVGFARTWRPDRLRPVEDRLRPPGAADVDSRADLLRGPVLRWFWPFAREEPHGHPAVYALVALAGDVLAPAAPELIRARLGTMLAFSLAAGGLFTFITRRWGMAAGCASAAAWALHPHLFALGHYATYDGLLASLWLGTCLAFGRTVEQYALPPRRPWFWLVLTGLLWGMTLGMKFTGWFLGIPLLAWCLWLRNRRAWETFLISGSISLISFVVLTPPLWADPWGGLLRFFASNLSRAQTIPIRTLFLGRVYETPTNSLPWYNVAVWVAVATPVTFLALELLGVWRAIRERVERPVGLLLLFSALTVLVLRSLPHTPGHDGTRQLAAGLGGLTALAGPGLAGLTRSWPRAATRLLTGCVIAEGAVSVWLFMPVPLAYYSPLIGGLPGAVALGLEPTYYWDALSDQALHELDSRVPTGRTVFFASNPITGHYRQTGRLKAGIFPFEGRNYAWYVVQNRPGAMGAVERGLVRRLGREPRYILSEKFGVPLVWAFPVDEVESQFRTDVPADERRGAP
jgi:hypothetical protein